MKSNICFYFNKKIIEVEMLLASGEIKTYSRESNSDLFPAILCSLGCLGIILTAKIQCEKAFRLEQIEYSAKLEDVCVICIIALQNSRLCFRF